MEERERERENPDDKNRIPFSFMTFLLLARTSAAVSSGFSGAGDGFLLLFLSSVVTGTVSVGLA